MKNNEKLISIITPSFNTVHYINEVYDSISSQDHDNWEWVVTDDCSTDGTYEKLNKLKENDSRIKLYRNDCNRGASYTRNNSIKKAKGQYLTFLDSDDIWLKEKLKTQLEYMIKNRYAVTTTSYKIYDKGKIIDGDYEGVITYEDLLKKKINFGCSTVMIDREQFDSLSLPLIKRGQDYAFWLSLLKTGKDAYHIQKTLTLYRIRHGSLSSNKIKKAYYQWKIYRKIEKLNLIESFYYYSHYIARAFQRR